ncbi:MAG: acyltransferase [Oscillospiraceae bacterium]|nr:acyltransferase [Oscillospiraceae bacterium]
MDYCFAHGFRAGKNFQYNSGYPIDANWPWLISVGDDVTLSSNVRLLAHDASTAKTGVHTKIGIILIGNNVFIGADTIVLCNTRIGDNVIIGAGSVVTGDVPSDSVYAGNPARLICTFQEYQKKHKENQNNHPIFREHTWQEWSEAPIEEREAMREKLKETFGYL